MKYLPATAYQIQRLDRFAIERLSIPSLKLMESAGRKSSRIILKGLEPYQQVAIFCGKGNNGGDGLVIARHLLENGIRVSVFLTAAKTDLKPDCRVNYARFIDAGGKIIQVEDLKGWRKIKTRIAKYTFIVDALFGVGLKGNLPKFYQQLINCLNQSANTIISIDVPSGLDATSGRIFGACIKASQTITFTLPKKGFFRNAGPSYCGRILVVDIGIPHRLLKKFRIDK